MKCRICGSECPPGAKLCRDCAAARKRAFAATVTVPLLAAAGVPSVRSHRFAPKPQRHDPKPPKVQVQAPAMKSVRRGQPAARTQVATTRAVHAVGMKSIRRGHAARTQAAVARATTSGSLPIVWVVGAMVAVAVMAFVGLRTLGWHGRSAEPPDIPAAEATHASLPASPLLPPVTAQPEASAGGASAPIAVQSPAEAGSASALPAQAAPPKLPVRKRAPPEVIKAPPPATPPAAVDEPQKVVDAPVRLVETTRTDPLQKLTGALARCAREEMIARLGCEQRARAQYCGDSWGQVPQCAIGPSTDHGQ
jgi:hypothetical protein